MSTRTAQTLTTSPRSPRPRHPTNMSFKGRAEEPGTRMNGQRRVPDGPSPRPSRMLRRALAAPYFAFPRLCHCRVPIGRRSGAFLRCGGHPGPPGGKPEKRMRGSCPASGWRAPPDRFHPRGSIFVILDRRGGMVVSPPNLASSSLDRMRLILPLGQMTFERPLVPLRSAVGAVTAVTGIVTEALFLGPSAHSRPTDGGLMLV